MRKVTMESVKAFLKGENFRKGNTEVEDDHLYLFGNCIAFKSPKGDIYVTNAGYGTVTTRERLNGLAELLIRCRPFGQKNFVQVIGETPWDGGWTKLRDVSRIFKETS